MHGITGFRCVYPKRPKKPLLPEKSRLNHIRSQKSPSFDIEDHPDMSSQSTVVHWNLVGTHVEAFNGKISSARFKSHAGSIHCQELIKIEGFEDICAAFQICREVNAAEVSEILIKCVSIKSFASVR